MGLSGSNFDTKSTIAVIVPLDSALALPEARKKMGRYFRVATTLLKAHGLINQSCKEI